MFKTARINNKVDGRTIDITVKNNPHHILAPTWDLVMGLKNKRITWEQYEHSYVLLLKERFHKKPEDFYTLIEQAQDKDVYLVCFCSDERFCHRRLAKAFLESL